MAPPGSVGQAERWTDSRPSGELQFGALRVKIDQHRRARRREHECFLQRFGFTPRATAPATPMRHTPCDACVYRL